MCKKYILIVTLFCTAFNAHIKAQNIFGEVYDTEKGTPLVGATVYLNGTSIGTITNDSGKFTISTDRIINTSLIISYVGYKSIVINDAYSDKKIEVTLMPELDGLDEVIVETDTWTREKKLREFKRQFLGTSNIAKACRILNEDDIDLEFVEGINTLVASSDVPLQILNSHLGYTISYQLEDFNAKYDNPGKRTPYCRYVYYEGQSFYKNLEHANISLGTFNSRREEAYKGSTLHFLRALVFGNISSEGFKFFYEGRPIAQSRVYSSSRDGANTIIKFKQDFQVRYRYGKTTLVRIIDTDKFITVYPSGVYTPAKNIEFHGAMSFERVGDALPLDYQKLGVKL